MVKRQRSRRSTGLALSLAIGASLLQLRAGLSAQEAQVRPPQLRELPELAAPADATLPADGRVEATITVAADGSASVDDCGAEPAVCAVVARGLAAARFEPAQRDGVAIAARVRIVLRLAPPPAAAANPSPRAAATEAPPPPANAADGGAASAAPAAEGGSANAATVAPVAQGSETPQPLLDYGARGRAPPVQPGARRLELAEMRDLPGAFGDPFRAVDALPGVVPVLSGLPYFYIRGSPPAGTLYIYDDIPMPALFHLAFGPAVIHPLMVGPITLYSGVAPARYGRITGGVIAGEGPATPDGSTHAEAELRLIDLSGYLQTDALGGTVTASVRYGYPGLLLSVFSPTVSLAYWDYQLRYATQLTAADRFELVVLGSNDSLSISDQPSNALAVAFHRAELRLMHRAGASEFGAALLLGWEHSELGSQFQLQASRIGPRLWWEHALGGRNRLRLSADMQGISGYFSSIIAPGDLNRETSDIGLVGNVRGRSLWGAQLELTLRPWTALELRFGARADAWLQSGGAQAVLDPRLRLILHASDTLEFHVAAGVVHQPAVFFLPLPGIADLANDEGLQTALQSEAGVGWDAPYGLRAELQAFYHRYDNLVFTDTLLLRNTLDTVCSPHSAIQLDCKNLSVPKRIDGSSYGLELFLRRPISERLSGFVSYTLAFSAVQRVAGQPYTPSWDVRHVGNVVMQWRIAGGLSAGLRLFVRSGKMHGDFLLDDMRQLIRSESRLPWFTRLDAELAYAWPTHWGRMRVALEWLNTTMAKEPIDNVCSGIPPACRTTYLPAIYFPNLSLRGEH